MSNPRWLVCEDGTEYTDRLQRFLGAEFRFERVTDAAALLAAVAPPAGAAGPAATAAGPAATAADPATTAADPAAGVIMDLDFRRTPDDLLVDENGGSGRPLAPEERSRLTESQGIFVLRALRRAGCRLPVILCADLEDPAQVAFLERTLGPLAVAPSSESITALARRMRGC
ncbi:MAG: hypothetical protein HY906_04125 [Deltaproteobacteria bacterium]|nr:hypothetical protein [Deltaproteobacteria bacterium]